MRLTFRTSEGTATVVFADHSYLANKALWDDYSLCSVTPQPDTAKVFETANSSAKEVAKEFFYNDKPLPNRRMTPFTTGLDETAFDALFPPAHQQQFSGCLADKIAAHLMVEGRFNTNSTLVDAWTVLLSSLKGKPVAYGSSAYVYPTDESHLKSSALQSEADKRFGRKLEIVSFRWLGNSEV